MDSAKFTESLALYLQTLSKDMGQLFECLTLTGELTLHIDDSESVTCCVHEKLSVLDNGNDLLVSQTYVKQTVHSMRSGIIENVIPYDVVSVRTDTLNRYTTGNDLSSLEGSTASFDHGRFDLEPEDVFIVDQMEKSETEDNCLTTENLENNESIEVDKHKASCNGK